MKHTRFEMDLKSNLITLVRTIRILYLLVSFIYTPNSLKGSVVTRTGNDIFCSLNFNYTESQGGEMQNKCKINVSNINGVITPMLVI